MSESKTPRTNAIFDRVYNHPGHASEIVAEEVSKLETELNQCRECMRELAKHLNEHQMIMPSSEALKALSRFNELEKGTK